MVGRARVISAHPRSTPALSRLTRAEAIEHYASLFRTAVLKREPGGDFALPLSDGRDSRHIFLELCRAGRNPALLSHLRDVASPFE